MTTKLGCQDLTSNNDLRNSIVNKIINLLADFCSYGFSTPLVKSEDWSTTITLMLSKIALEIEMDWRDFDIFVLIVRLENGKLPCGYYVSNGRPCRYHLQKVITDRKWNVDQNTWTMISPEIKSRKKYASQSADAIFDRFCAYKKILDSCINELVAQEEVIFN